MDYSLLIEYLRQKKGLTNLEKDIWDTWNELQKSPFDYGSAQIQVAKNDTKYPMVYAKIASLPTTVPKARGQITDIDIRYNLAMQLEALVEKAGWQISG